MIKSIIILFLIAIFSFWHIHGSTTNLESHLLHQELFFIPIILASFWFRLPAGIATALFVSVIYLSSMLPHMESSEVRIAVYSQMFLYLFIATLIGWLRERLHKQQHLMLQEEKLKSITKLATALISEIQEVVHGLEIKLLETREQQKPTSKIDIIEEIDKLKRLTNSFNKFSALSDDDLLSHDLNEVVKKTHKKLKPRFKEAQQTMTVELDHAGCPSMLITEPVVHVLEALIINAMEASPQGSDIIVRSIRKGAHCHLEVRDQGHGVKEIDVPKLFSPFFTTKHNGHGLSLAAGKKIMREREGELRYEPGKPSGAIFTLIIPRENMDANIEKFVSDRISE